MPEAPWPTDPWAGEIDEFRRFLAAHKTEPPPLAADQLRSVRAEFQGQFELLLEAEVERRRSLLEQLATSYGLNTSPKPPKFSRESKGGLERPPRSFRPPIATLCALRALFSEREYRLRIEPIASDGQVLVAGMWSRGDALWQIRTRQVWTWMQLVAAAARLALIEGFVRLNRSKGELR